MSKLNFIFFGRFETEKGFDILLETIQISIQKNLKHNFYLFGEGALEQQIYSQIPAQNLVKITDSKQILNFKPTENQIILCQQQDYPKTIKPILQTKIDYTIIPSKLLETFGYTALESIQTGTPILSTNLGNLDQFTLSQHKFNLNSQSLLKLISNLNKPTPQEKTKIESIAKNFSSQTWTKNIQQLIPANTKKILLVSDFLKPIGGTEKHLHQIANHLNQEGYTVEIFSSNQKPSLLNLLKAIHNKHQAKLLKTKIQQFQPDLIWCHSIMRLLGPLALKIINQSTATKLITIHDFGLFTDYPSELKNLNQLSHNSLAFKLKSILLLNPIKKQLRLFTHILVPSKFMQEPIRQILNQKIELLPHFLETSND